MPIIPACHAFLSTNAVGQWHETYRLKDKEKHAYLHTIQRDMAILRVEVSTKTKTIRAFYWFYNLQDAILFNEHVGTELKLEAHEIITTPRCRMFYDIDLELSEFEKEEFADYFGFDLFETEVATAMNEIGKYLAAVLKDATLLSFEEHGITSTELVGFDWMFTMRNRPLSDDKYKISIHLITNLMVPFAACVAISDHVRYHVLPNNLETFGISDLICDALVASIDVTQYHNNGSLSLPYSTKNGIYANRIIRHYTIPYQRYLLSNEDQFSISNLDLKRYNIVNKTSLENIEANPDFVQAALAHVNNIRDYDPRVWDINASILKGSTMFVKRYAPSLCSICERFHDNDNTLFLIFNSEMGIASWKCTRVKSMRAIVFYEEDLSKDDDDELAAFAKKSSVKKSSATPRATVASLPSLDDATLADIETFAQKHVKLDPPLSIELEDPFDMVKWRPQVFYYQGKPLKIDTTIDWECDPSAEYNDDKKEKPKAPKKLRDVKRKVARKDPPKVVEEYDSDDDE